MSTLNPAGTRSAGAAPARSARRAVSTETRPAFKTTELIAYVAAAIGVLIAGLIVDDGPGGLGAHDVWLYVTILTVGYMVSRGLAKSGSFERDADPRAGDADGR